MIKLHKKKISKIIIALTVLLASVVPFFSPIKVRAAILEPVLSIQPVGGAVVPGYFNSINYSFIATLTTGDLTDVKQVELLMDGDFFASGPIYGTKTTDTTEVFLSGTSNDIALQALVPEGIHIFSAKITYMALGVADEEVAADPLTADYTSPIMGSFVAEPVNLSKPVVAIGDAVLLTYVPVIPDPTSTDIESISASLNARPIIWTEVVSGLDTALQASYIVQPGDQSTSTKLNFKDVVLTDRAGNQRMVGPYDQAINFTIDTAVPLLSVTSTTLTSQITQGDKIILEGTTSPSSEVLLTINSKTVQVSTIADANGTWKIVFDSSVLEPGTHTAFLTATSLVGNKTILSLGTFELVLPEPIEAATEPVTGTVTIAFVKSEQNSVTDVVPAVVKPVISKTVDSPDLSAETASNKFLPVPQIASGESTVATGINWSAWILLLAIVVLVSALATAGYYGYSWIGARNSQGLQRQPDESMYDPQSVAPANKSGSGPPAEKKPDLPQENNAGESLEKSQDDSQPPITRW